MKMISMDWPRPTRGHNFYGHINNRISIENESVI